MKWRVWYEDRDVNGDGIIPALQCAIASDIVADTAEEAAMQSTIGYSFEGKRTFVCVPAEGIEKVTLYRDPRPVYSVGKD